MKKLIFVFGACIFLSILPVFAEFNVFEGKLHMINHVVKTGQNLYGIARFYGTSADEIKLLNDLKSNKIIENQKLQIISRPHTIVASWYGPGFEEKPMANGKIFYPANISAAHKDLPFGSVVEIKNPKGGRSISVKITDRGPFIEGRDYDLSEGAAEKLRMKRTGVAPLVAQVVYVPSGR